MDAVNKRCFDLVSVLREKFPNATIIVDFNPEDTNWIEISGNMIGVRLDSYSVIDNHYPFKTHCDLLTAEEVLAALAEKA